MEEESTSDNHLTPVVSKLINCIIVLVLLVVVLVVILLIYVPAPKEDVDTKIESPVPDKNGNFTRIVRLESRKGDNAPMAYIEILGK